jgi:hypothetical protein
MTWLWIAMFVIGCTALLATYVYFVEIRVAAAGTPSDHDDGYRSGRDA